jgi:hypothetical protein
MFKNPIYPNCCMFLVHTFNSEYFQTAACLESSIKAYLLSHLEDKLKGYLLVYFVDPADFHLATF